MKFSATARTRVIRKAKTRGNSRETPKKTFNPNQHNHQDAQDHDQAGQLLTKEAGQPVGEIAQRLHQELAELAGFHIIHDLILKTGAHDAATSPARKV